MLNNTASRMEQRNENSILVKKKAANSAIGFG
jgi:hypothetical protein